MFPSSISLQHTRCFQLFKQESTLNYHVSYCSKHNDPFPINCSSRSVNCLCIDRLYVCVFPAVTCPRTAPCSLRRCTSRGECASSSVCPHTRSTSASGPTTRWVDGVARARLCHAAVLHWLQIDMDSDLSPSAAVWHGQRDFPDGGAGRCRRGRRWGTRS